MKKEKGKFILILGIFLFLISFTIAQQPNPPQTNVNINLGLTIDFPKILSVQINTDQVFNFHVFNISNGLRLDNTSVNCTFHLFNFTGVHIISEQNIPFDTEGNDWEITVQGANFSHNRVFSVLIDCNDGGFGGFASISFHVTPIGNIHEIPESILYVLMLFFFVLIDLLILYLIIILPSKNEKDEGGLIIKLVQLKYVKFVLMGIFYPMIIVTLNLLNGLAVNFTNLTIFSGVVGFLFLTMLRAAWIYTIVIILLILYNLIKDKNDRKLM